MSLFTGRHYAALGKMLVAFQGLDSSVTMCLTNFLQPEKDPWESLFNLLVVETLPFRKKLDLIRAFPETVDLEEAFPTKHERSPHYREEFLAYKERIAEGCRLAHKAEERRNELVHAIWVDQAGFGNTPESVLMLRRRVAKGKIKTTSRMITPEQIQEATQIANEAATILSRVCQEVVFLLKMGDLP